MGWDFEQRKPIIYNPNTDSFETDISAFEVVSQDDLDAEKEINDIKRLVKNPIDRMKFFKKGNI